jgi:uncharacterized protein YqgC (DUF456 family)
MTDQTVTLLVGVAMAVGLIGTAVPWFPDILIVWGAGLVYGLAVGWGTWGGWLFAIMTVAALAALAAEIVLSAAGARAGGASGWAIAAGLLAALAGLLVFGPLGALVGFGAGILAIEWLRVRDGRRAVRATGGALLGWGVSFLVKFGLAAAMVAAWGVWVAAG